jgi:hypothetical protein
MSVHATYLWALFLHFGGSPSESHFVTEEPLGSVMAQPFAYVVVAPIGLVAQSLGIAAY